MQELTKWNHNSVGNPHEQYVMNNSDYTIRPFNYDFDNCYFKLLTIYIPHNTNIQFEASFDVIDSSSFDYAQDDFKWTIDVKIGCSENHTYDDNFETYGLIKGENKRCILTCNKEIVKVPRENSRIENGQIINEVVYYDVEKYRYDLYIIPKIYTNGHMYIRKNFIHSTTEDYKIHTMTRCNSLEDLQLDKCLRYYISNNNNPVIYTLYGEEESYGCYKIFNIDLAYLRQHFVNYNGVYELIMSRTYDRRTYKNRYAKFMVNASNYLIPESKKDILKDGIDNLDYSIEMLYSYNYEDNLMYVNNNGTIEFWYTGTLPVKITLIRKDNDNTNKIFNLYLDEEFELDKNKIEGGIFLKDNKIE